MGNKRDQPEETRFPGEHLREFLLPFESRVPGHRRVIDQAVAAPDVGQHGQLPAPARRA